MTNFIKQSNLIRQLIFQMSTICKRFATTNTNKTTCGMTKKVTTEMIVEEGTPRSNGNHDTNSSNHTGEQKHKQHIQHPKQHHQQPELNNYDVGLLSDPITPEAKKSTKMVISIRDQKSGFPVIEYERVHDKLMHLIWARIFLILHTFTLHWKIMPRALQFLIHFLNLAYTNYGLILNRRVEIEHLLYSREKL